MAREIKTDDLSPLGSAVLRGAEAKGMRLSEVGYLLGWPATRIYDVIRAGSVRSAWVRDLAVLLDLDLSTLIALDARGAKR